MFATMPVTAPSECEVRPLKTELFVDAAKKAHVNLPPGATYRKCAAPGEGARIITKPDSGGTTACVFYEFIVDPKNPEVQVGKRKAAVAKSMADKSCPAVDYSAQSYPGKDWFFLADNVPLENAYRVKARVESGGLAFLDQEQRELKDPKAGIDHGTTALGVYSVSPAPPLECRVKQSFFQERFAACYVAEIYNKTVRGGWTVHVALRKSGEYKFIESKLAKK